MRTSRRHWAVIATVALIIGGALTVGPATAGTINCITVSNGTGTFTGLFGPGGGTTGCAATPGTTWNLAAPIVLGDGQTAVLTQNQAGAASSLPSGQPGFNFDTSDFGAANYTISINGLAPIADLGVLNFGGVDNPTSNTINEAHNWTLIASNLDLGGGHLLDIYTGYVDTLHSNPCVDADGNCLPTSAGPPTIPNTIFLNNATVALGNPSNLPGYPTSPHCDVNNANPITAGCFDAGAILLVEHIRQTPEPSSLFLLGAGLMGAAAYGRRCMRRKS